MYLLVSTISQGQQIYLYYLRKETYNNTLFNTIFFIKWN